MRCFARPMPILVWSDETGLPRAIVWRGQRQRVQVCNRWRRDGEWWREPVSREYFRLVVVGAVLVVYRDARGDWYVEQVLD